MRDAWLLFSAASPTRRGSVNKRGHTYIYNTDIELLTYVKELLKRLNIESTGPKLTGYRRGTIIHDPRTGKQYVSRKDCYYIYILARSNTNFYKHVGFTITRKQRRIENYIKRSLEDLNSYPPFPNQHPPNTSLIITILPRAGLEPATSRSSAGRSPSLSYRGSRSMINNYLINLFIFRLLLGTKLMYRDKNIAWIL